MCSLFIEGATQTQTFNRNKIMITTTPFVERQISTNFLNKKTSVILESVTSEEHEIINHIIEAGEDLYTDAHVSHDDKCCLYHDDKCCLYININLIEHIYYFDHISSLNSELLTLIEEAKMQGSADNDFYDKVLILFNVK